MRDDLFFFYCLLNVREEENLVQHPLFAEIISIPTFFKCHICLLVEEVSMKWMDRPSVTEMERGGVYEMDRRKSTKNMEMPLK